MKGKKLYAMLMVFALLVSTFAFSGSVSYAAGENQYLKVNNMILEFKEIVYVDGATGSDTSGNGSIDKPFQSVVKAMDYLSVNCREGGAILLEDGIYDVNALFTLANHYDLDLKYNEMKLSMIARNMGKVTFVSQRMEWQSIQLDATAKFQNKMYGIIMKASKGIHLAGSALKGEYWNNEYYNCVVEGSYGGFYGGIVAENTLFIGEPNTHYFSKGNTGSALNSASSTAYMEPARGTVKNALYNASFDSTYNITTSGWQNAGVGTNPDGSTAHIGVYGGQYAWGSTAVECDKDGNPPGGLKVESLEISGSKNSIEVSESLGLTSVVKPDNATNKALEWSSKDPSIATVDANGVVTGVKAGTVTIVAKTTDGSNLTAEFVVTVVKKTDPNTLIDFNIRDLQPGKTALSPGSFKTNTTKVLVDITASTEGFVKVYLMDKSNRAVAEATIYVTPTTQTREFTMLTSANTYSLKFENTGTTAVDMNVVVRTK